MSLLKKGASHGYAPRSLICCICNCLLTKGSPSYQIQVFSCGHATHLQCELLESDSLNKGSLSGCPVCMPKKNTQRPRDKSILPEKGSVNKGSSRSRRSQGTSFLHLHEDSFESSQQISRVSQYLYLLLVVYHTFWKDRH